ncbi:GTPase HflX [Ignavibacteria bacterium]|nr:GTPase HflX [Bacteroidota bacterium]MCZ2131928.1 GTPase HflX [Bacteroidota bacterium]
MKNVLLETAQPIEKALAVAVTQKGTRYRETAVEYLDELAFLAENAGAEVVARLYQERECPDVATAVGKGKVEEIKLLIEEQGITLVLFDDELTPIQFRNLERELQVKVLDRSAVILDIFARRARTAEAKLQVELAQLQYMLPRLSRMWTHLSKQYGGIGARGPGETQIETDRRLVRARISELQEKLNAVERQKFEQRKGRSNLPRFALVGYTNAGKSTLLNVISDGDAYVANQLFATLDSTVRQFIMPNGAKALISDTVGFIRKLPVQLIASFRSTLAEVREADVLLHVIDASNPGFREQVAVVQDTLKSIGCEQKPVVYVLNKIDSLTPSESIGTLLAEFPGAVPVSASRLINIDTLLDALVAEIVEQLHTLAVLIPYSQMKSIDIAYAAGEVIEREDGEDGTRLVIANISDKTGDYLRRLMPFQIKN